MSEPKRAKSSHPQVSPFPILEAPKTSEYAFFKKLKKDIGCTKSRSVRKANIQSKISKVNGPNRVTSTRSSYSSEKERPSDKPAFLSPIGYGSNNLGTQKGTSSGINQRALLFCGDAAGFDQNLVLSPIAVAGKNLRNQYAEKGVFQVKRQRLRQLTADLFPETRECNSKGFDLVSALISRLLPRGNETETYAQNASIIQDRSCRDDVSPRYQLGLGRLRERVLSKPRGNETEYSNSKGKMIDAEYPSASFLNQDAPEKTSLQNAFKIQDELCWNDVFSNSQSSRAMERFLSKWDMTTSDLSCIKYDKETDFQDEGANYECCAGCGSIQYTVPESDSSFCILFENFRQSGADHIKQLYSFHAPQLDEFHTLNEAAREVASPLLLSWDVKDDKGKNSYSPSGNSLDFACQIVDNNAQNITTCSTSLYSNHSLDFLLRPYIHSTGTYMHDMGGSHQDDSAVADANPFPLNLSLPPKHLTTEANWDMFNHFEDSNTNLPKQDPPRCTNFESLLSRGLDVDLGWKFLPKTNFLEYYSSKNHIFQFHFKEDLCSYGVEQDEETVLYCSPGDRTLAFHDSSFGILNKSSASFNVSPGKKRMDHLLLLDYPDRDRTEEVKCYDEIPWRSS